MPPNLKLIIEGALLSYNKPLSNNQLIALFENIEEQPSTSDLSKILQNIAEDYKDRAVELVELASGWSFQLRQEITCYIRSLWDDPPQRYTRAMLESLALIAYRQPITRGEIEDVRGVSVSSRIVKTLQEREWIRIVGHKDIPGRPAMFATTKNFLDYFNLKSLNELPPLNEIRSLDQIAKSLEEKLTSKDSCNNSSLTTADDEDKSVETDKQETNYNLTHENNKNIEQGHERLFKELDNIEQSVKIDFDEYSEDDTIE